MGQAFHTFALKLCLKKAKRPSITMRVYKMPEDCIFFVHNSDIITYEKMKYKSSMILLLSLK
jgi:hypothetical protein